MEEVNTFLVAAKSILTDREWLDAIGSFLAGLGTIALTVVACIQLPKAALIQRETQKEQHKFQLARDAIRIFNHLREDLRQVRSPFGFSGELDELKNLPGDPEYIKRLQDNSTGGLIMLRLDKRASSLAEMNRLEPEFRAVFGETDAFEEMRKARHEIWVAATMIVNGEPFTKYSPVIWALGKQDKLSPEIDAAVKQIEEMCQPVLRGEK